MSEEKDIILYIFVNNSLKMGKGKIGGQCGHAVQYIVQNYYNRAMSSEYREYYDAWLSNNCTKVVLKADSKDIEQLKEQNNKVIVKDAGKTQIVAGSETVVAFYPAPKSVMYDIVKEYKLL